MAAVLVLLVLALIAALAFGGPKPIAPLASINAPFKNVDFSDVPAPPFGPGNVTGAGSIAP